MINFLQSCVMNAHSSNREQLVICLRWVDNCLEVYEDFIGLYSIPDIKEAPFLVLLRTFFQDQILVSIVVVASGMMEQVIRISGCKSGIAKSITDIESRALYTHCYGHSLNLAMGSTIKNIKVLTDVMDIIHEMTA